MKVVIQCAGKKSPGAGYLSCEDGRKVTFVGNPDLFSHSNELFARPDDLIDGGASTWREKLAEYNQQADQNPNGLYQAYQLYDNPVYEALVSKFKIKNVYILSAGWGLVRADYLLPYYDITFTKKAKLGNRRNYRWDVYKDFNMLFDSRDDDVCFLGGKDYLPLFCDLTSNYSGKRIVYYNSNLRPIVHGCQAVRFETATRTNWHYGCADFLIGQ